MCLALERAKRLCNAVPFPKISLSGLLHGESVTVMLLSSMEKKNTQLVLCLRTMGKLCNWHRMHYFCLV